jgi:hypothetical protein
VPVTDQTRKTHQGRELVEEIFDLLHQTIQGSERLISSNRVEAQGSEKSVPVTETFVRGRERSRGRRVLVQVAGQNGLWIDDSRADGQIIMVISNYF